MPSLDQPSRAPEMVQTDTLLRMGREGEPSPLAPGVSSPKGLVSQPVALVALDVDGVINDLSQRWLDEPDYQVDVVIASGYRLHIPTYMPELVRGLVRRAEVWWLTTWRSDANLEIAAHLGIPSLPVFDDGGSGGLDWKEEQARPLFERALAERRPVFWIEDFDGYRPNVPEGVVLIDTADRWVLHLDHLPPALL